MFKMLILRKTSTALPGASRDQGTYGLAPIFKESSAASRIESRNAVPTPHLSINDRVINSQALVLSIVVEHSLP